MSKHKCKRNDKSEKRAEKRDCRDLMSDCRLLFHCLFAVHILISFFYTFLAFFFISFFASFVCFLFCVTSSHVFLGALNSTAIFSPHFSFVSCLFNTKRAPVNICDVTRSESVCQLFAEYTSFFRNRTLHLVWLAASIKGSNQIDFSCHWIFAKRKMKPYTAHTTTTTTSFFVDDFNFKLWIFFVFQHRSQERYFVAKETACF